MTVLPTFLQRYFWDTDLATLDADRHATTVIARILALGDERAIRWINQTYPSDTIRSVLASSRELPRKTAMYWAKFYDIPEQAVRCLQPDFQRTARAIWSY